MAWRRTRPGKSGLGQQPTVSLGRKPKHPKTLRERLAATIAKGKAKKKPAELQAKRLPLPTGLVAGSIKSKIEKLRKKEKWSFRERHGRTDFYRYLDAVYRVQDWRDARESERWAQKVAALFEVRTRKNTHPIRIIIDVSSDQNRHVKSDWSRTLQHALAEKVRRSAFLKFLHTIGGPAGFKAKMAARNKGRPKK
jgi:hypothetical protein